MGVKLAAASGGSVELVPTNTASNYTATLPAATTTVVGTDTTQTLTNKTLGSGLVMSASAITSGTAVASTSGTSIDFTSIPSWVKRITVMFNGVSTNGTSLIQIQVGDGSVNTTGYTCAYGTGPAGSAATSGFVVTYTNTASLIRTGQVVLTLQTGNTWVETGVLSDMSNTVVATSSGGAKTLSGTLDRVRITTINGTDTFDAGSINILYE